MCDCVKDIQQQAMKMYPEATNIIMPVDLISGKLLLEAEKVVIKNGKTKRSHIFIALDKCPFCGVMYGEAKP